MPELKLGKKPFIPSTRDLRYFKFRMPKEMPSRPRYFGNESVVKDWGMLGNDGAGDCVWAGAGHEHMTMCGVTGKGVEFQTKDIITAYSEVTGYVPGDDSTDNGTEVRTAMEYRKATGVKDSKGEYHKIGAFVRIDPKKTDYLFEALYLFDVVGLGIQFPDSAMDQFDQGKPWKVVKGAEVEGGHYVPVIAKRKEGLICVTWGQLQVITMGFLRKYADEAWTVISEDDLKDGKSIEGFDMDALRQYLGQIG